jgi:[ribosomal protein S18]-alanine N-acetyltransferase
LIENPALAFSVQPMTARDIPAVMDIEFVAFSAPWSARAYEYEIHHNEMANYFVARTNHAAPAHRSFLQRWLGRDDPIDENPLVGYAGFWMMVDEAHISTIATHADWRRRGVGELLMVSMLERAIEIDAHMMTLEARVSNIGAQALYRKFGFEIVGVRKKYYSDNGEDALIMSTLAISTAEYQRRLQELKSALVARLSQ